MITVFGSINLDLIFALDRLPAPGETVLGPSVRSEPGGKGANQAVAAALQGASVVMVGAVGRDGMAVPALTGLIAAGVDVSRVARAEAGTGCAAICTADGKNQIAVGAGANLLARADQVEAALLGPSHTLLLQMECDPDETAALIRRVSGCRIILNLAPAAPLSRDALEAVDILVVNEAEAAWLAAYAPGLTGPNIVHTLGERGAEYRGTIVPAWPVHAVDSTAAGDCFTGALAAGLDRGLDMQDALRLASAAAALCCTRQGSQGSLPTHAETELFISAPALVLHGRGPG